MGLEVIGVGLPRTGTTSLKTALERLLQGPCYHMSELFQHPSQVAGWQRALAGEPDWDLLFDGYVATLDWPAADLWQQVVDEYPDALVLLSVRESAETWWNSFDSTILEMVRQVNKDRPIAAILRRQQPRETREFMELTAELVMRFNARCNDKHASIEKYRAHSASVIEAIAPERLIVWQTSDGWGPLCDRLGLPVPDEPFPHVNTTSDYLHRAGLDPDAPASVS